MSPGLTRPGPWRHQEIQWSTVSLQRGIAERASGYIPDNPFSLQSAFSTKWVQICGWVTRNKHHLAVLYYVNSEPEPTIILVHGGKTNREPNPLAQLLLALGYSVLLGINARAAHFH